METTTKEMTTEKTATTMEVVICFLEGMKVERSMKELKVLKRKVEVPKKGFFHKKKKLKAIQKAKKKKKIYQEIIDLYELQKKLKGKLVKKEIHYDAKNPDGSEVNYIVFILSFPCENKKKKFEENFFELYPELKANN